MKRKKDLGFSPRGKWVKTPEDIFPLLTHELKLVAIWNCEWVFPHVLFLAYMLLDKSAPISSPLSESQNLSAVMKFLLLRYYSAASAWCFIILASEMYISSSLMLVERSATRSRFRLTRIRSMARPMESCFSII